MNNLKEIREAKKMSQRELAIKVKHADPTVDQAMISFLERGDVYPGEKLMAALCSALECPEDAIYTGIEAAFIPAAEIVHSETTDALARILMFGAENAIPRAQLVVLTGWPDRELRKNIEKARSEGMVIANDQNGKGYYRPDTQEELARCYKQSRSRTLAQLRQQKYIRRRMNGC